MVRLRPRVRQGLLCGLLLCLQASSPAGARPTPQSLATRLTQGLVLLERHALVPPGLPQLYRSAFQTLAALLAPASLQTPQGETVQTPTLSSGLAEGQGRPGEAGKAGRPGKAGHPLFSPKFLLPNKGGQGPGCDESTESLRQAFVGLLAAHPERDPEELLYALEKAVTASLGDPYTRFYTPQEWKDYEARLGGLDDTCLGMAFESSPLYPGHHSVSFVTPEGAAARAGIEEGDELEGVEGTSVHGLTRAQVLHIARPAAGHSLRVQVRHHGHVLTVLASPQPLHIPRVSATPLANAVGYVRIRSFSENTEEELAQALGTLRAAGSHSLILDLRDNRGGYVATALDACSLLLPPHTHLATLLERDHPALRLRALPLHPEQRHGFSGIAVLINRQTASAAELLAAALEEQAGALTVGQRSFGKALVQEVFEQGDGSVFKITKGRYLTPAGRDLQGHGLVPRFELPVREYAPLASDANVAAASMLLRKGPHASAGAPWLEAGSMRWLAPGKQEKFQGETQGFP